MLTRARPPRAVLVLGFAAGVSILASQACLKSEDEIEIVDASLGTPTPKPTRTPSPKPTPKTYFLDAFTSSLVANLTLADAEAKQLGATITAGQGGQRVAGEAASAALAKAVADAAGWLVENDKVGAQALARANAGARLLFAGYFAAEEEAGTNASLFDAHLTSLGEALGRAYTTFAGAASPDAAEYSSFALTIVNNVFTQFTDDGLAASKVKDRSTLLVSVLSRSYTVLPTLSGAPLASYVSIYAKNAGVVIASFATAAPDREAYVAAYRDGLRAALQASIPAADVGVLDGIEAKLLEGIASATQR